TYNINTHSLIFDVNGGTIVNNDLYNYDSLLPVPTRSHYVFLGWALEEISNNGIGDYYLQTPDLSMFEGPVNMYATWRAEEYTIIFNVNGGDSVTPTELTVIYGTTGTFPIAIRTGFTFSGWYKNSDGTSIFSNAGTFSIIDLGNDGDIINVYAKWIIESYNLVFDENGGSSILNSNYLFGSQLPIPSREGYTFNGWTLEEEPTNGIGTTYTYTP
ncbi:InlB B-repeat-containing protein, partial [Acholeplasma laidlawii]|uniref:InlB B-repeat-containing protein n=1 Tax=Acholeplasma laidlawii TaxID=2148 RepID=UPI0018C2EE0E